MAIRVIHDTSEHKTWFVTFTCYDWIPLFEITESYYLVYNWLKLLTDKYQIQTNAFVIMPNHVHLIIKLYHSAENLNRLIGNGKRFMAYALVDRLTQRNDVKLLTRLETACTEKERAAGQVHKIFQPSFDAKPIYTSNFLHQKLDYIHANPVSGKWNLCTEFTDYSHSSAAFYHDGRPHEFVFISDYRDDWL